MEGKIIFKARPHSLIWLAPELLIVFLFISFFVALPYFQKFFAKAGNLLFSLFSISILFLGLIIFFEWCFIEYSLSNSKVQDKRGLIIKREREIPLDKIQDLKIRIGVLGRIFNFGDLIIESAGREGKIIFNFIPNPKEKKLKIEKAIKDFYGKSASNN